MSNLRAVSLFSNCGAGDIGYRDAGFRFDVMAELDPRRLEVCLLNHPGVIGVPGDLRETWPEVVARYQERAGEEAPTLLAACPPCQGMSSARSGRGRGEDADAGSRDERNLLVTVIANVALELQPTVVVVENVPMFLTRKVRHPETNEPVSAASLLVSMLNDEYEAFPMSTDLCDYGVPQTRKRAFLTFVRRDAEELGGTLEHHTPYPLPTHVPDLGGEGPVNLGDILRQLDLPILDASAEDRAVTEIGGGLHSVPAWDARQYAMVAAIPVNSGGSAWENEACGSCGPVEVEEEDAVCPLCGEPLLRPVVRGEGGAYRLVKGFRSSSYRRMSSNLPASTVTTASGHVGSDRTIHPFENRLLSTLECANLQTFPPNFNWGNALQKWGHTNVRDMIGETVPPHFTRMHGLALRDILAGENTQLLLASDERCTRARRKLCLPNLSNRALENEPI